MLVALAVTLALVSGCVLPGIKLPPGSGDSDPPQGGTTSQEQQGPGDLKVAFTGELMELIQESASLHETFTLQVRVIPKEGEAKLMTALLPVATDAPKWEGMRFEALESGTAQVTVKLSEGGNVLYERTTPVAIAAKTTTQAAIELRLDEPALPSAKPSLVRFVGHEVDGYRDGIGLNAKLAIVVGGMALDPAKNLYIADQGNHLIRKVSPRGVVTTFAGRYEASGDLGGPGQGGYIDGPRRQAQFRNPKDLVFDAAGNLYVSDAGNSRIRRISPAGVVQTFAGSGQTGFNNGSAEVASFTAPGPLAMGADGLLYVADQNKIRTVTPGGQVDTYMAGPFTNQADGVSDTLGLINDLIVGPNGVLYVASGHRILRINPDKSVDVLIQGGTEALDDPDPSKARVFLPTSLALDGTDGLLIVDDMDVLGNSALRRLTFGGGLSTVVDAQGGAMRVNAPILRVDAQTYCVNGGRAKLFF
jgi:sugar lactone lactonase YvrE